MNHPTPADAGRPPGTGLRIMYDFFYGKREDIYRTFTDYLIFVKRLLPRWLNSIPDGEFVTILEDIELAWREGARTALVETGVGASTIALVGSALRSGRHAFSWDLNAAKGAAVRQVLSDTLGRHLGRNIDDVWTFIGGDSGSPYIGLPVLAELAPEVSFCFFDSEHTLRVLRREVELVQPFLSDGSVVAIDDASYDYAHTNLAYINMQRQKVGLPIIESVADNACRPFWAEINEYLEAHWQSVTHAGDSFAGNIGSDIYWSYYASDRASMNAVGMEKLDQLSKRYASWQLRSRRASSSRASSSQPFGKGGDRTQ